MELWLSHNVILQGPVVFSKMLTVREVLGKHKLSSLQLKPLLVYYNKGNLYWIFVLRKRSISAEILEKYLALLKTKYT